MNELGKRLEKIEEQLKKNDYSAAITDLRGRMRFVEDQLALLQRLHSPTHHPEGILDALRPVLEGLRSDVREIIRQERRSSEREGFILTAVDELNTAVGQIRSVGTEVRTKVTGLDGKLDSALERLSDNPTPEQVAAAVTELQGAKSDIAGASAALDSLGTKVDLIDPAVEGGPIGPATEISEPAPA